jgi:hypothetical protein
LTKIKIEKKRLPDPEVEDNLCLREGFWGREDGRVLDCIRDIPA